jgi:glutamate-1-semialdehyde 2,1-aminomutase
VTGAAAGDPLVVPYNDLDAVTRTFDRAGADIAAVIVEPVAANMGVVPPEPGFLDRVRALCTRFGALLIFDEVITGFRLGSGGAQELLGIQPDLTCLGKVMGGGFPCAAFGGRRDVMDQLAPAGPVYQAGTLSGNPVAVAAGLAALQLIETTDPYSELRANAEALTAGLANAFVDAEVHATVNRVESLFSLFFTDGPVRSFAEAQAADHGAYARFFHDMLEEGVYLPPSGYEGWFLSAAHADEQIERTVAAASVAARSIGRR